MSFCNSKALSNLFLVLILCCLPSVSFGQLTGIHRPYGALLAQHVRDNRVDYLSFKKDEDKLDLYLATLAEIKPAELERADQLAFYINAYNAYTIKLVLMNFKNGKPLNSIKKIGGFFKKPWSIKFCKIGGETYTLDNIEHDIIRPKFKDPRVHFAINCAAKSCPPLISRPYIGQMLEQQLDENTRVFLNDPKSTYLKGGRLYVTRIFKWFGEDFKNDPVAFVKKYAVGDFKGKLNNQESKIKVEYLDYDWSLNIIGSN